jgi:hypothetical protein
LGTFIKAGIAKKLFDEARKPANQAKAKELFQSVTGKGKGSGPSSSPPPGTPRY